MIGQTIAHYTITSKIGEGGMGEVYRATDTKLDREVALKVLPEEFTNDPERLGRFRREAKMLASLNHPGIGAIYGLEEAAPLHVLVLELIEGETLADRIRQGPIPIEEALKIALEIAEALEAAHEKGIIHRDLKPDNVKIGKGGQVKVLDFGLAKALETQPQAVDLSQTPTLTAPATATGIILGTAAYMSPEQAKGEHADRRADIWSFGVVLFEMLTGRKLFAAKSLSETLSAVLTQDPDWSELPSQLHYRMRDLIEHCLRKDLRSRTQSIGDVRLTIEDSLAEPEAVSAQSEIPSAGIPARWKRILPWALFGVMTILAAAAVSVFYFGETPERPGLVHSRISKPKNLTFEQENHVLAISPEGRFVVLSGYDEEGVSRLWLLELASHTFQALDGAEGGRHPFWSPDSRFVGFFSRGDDKLKKIAVSGGPAIALADAPALSFGATWSRDGIILFSPSLFEWPIYRVSSAGGAATPLTVLEESRQETSHHSPQFLPDGGHFLYVARSSRYPPVIKLGSVSTGESRVLLNERSASFAQPGYLLFRRQSTLMAQPFDAEGLELTGEPIPIVQGLRSQAGADRHFSVSESGVLVYRGASTNRRLRWWDRAGRRLDSVADPGPYSQIALSPDEKYVAVEQDGDIWLLELSSGVFSRFTSAQDGDAVWSPDSRKLLFGSGRTGTRKLFVKSIGGSEAELLYQEEANQWPEDWSPDGRQAIYISDQGKSSYGLDLRSPDRKPKLLFESNFVTDEYHVSPDGQWIAYGSMESGMWEIHLAAFPDFAKIRQVSVGGGIQPLWRRDGKELFYLRSDGMLMSVEVKPGADSPETSAPQTLFQTGIEVNPLWNQYCVTADGQRFLTVEPEEDEQIGLIINWPELLRPTSEQ